MKRKLSLVLLISVFLLISSCAENSTDSDVSASGYIDQLYASVKDADLPIMEKDPLDPTDGYDSDIGDYIYTGYILTDGVYAATYEDPEQSNLLRVHIMVDLTLAKREALSTGSFAIYNTISYFDKKDADKISESLNTSDISASGTSEASGKNGVYKYVVDTAGNRVFLIYTISNA